MTRARGRGRSRKVQLWKQARAEKKRGGTTAAPILSSVPIKHDEDKENHHLQAEVELQHHAHKRLRGAPDWPGSGCGWRS